METLKLAAVSDLHIGVENNNRYYSKNQWLDIFNKMNNVDGLIMSGDLTHRGTTEQAFDLALILNSIGIGDKSYAVLGNHDEDAGNEAEISRILEGEAGVTMLHGNEYKISNGIKDIGIAGMSTSIGRDDYNSLRNLKGKQRKEKYDELTFQKVYPKFEKAISNITSQEKIWVQHYPIKPIRGVPNDDSVAYDALPPIFESTLDRTNWTAIIDGHEHGPHTPVNPADIIWKDFTRGGNPIFHMAAPLHKQLKKSPIFYLAV